MQAGVDTPAGKLVVCKIDASCTAASHQRGALCSGRGQKGGGRGGEARLFVRSLSSFGDAFKRKFCLPLTFKTPGPCARCRAQLAQPEPFAFIKAGQTRMCLVWGRGVGGRGGRR